MNESKKYCRLCANLVEHKLLQNIFGRTTNTILKQVEEITAIMLRNSKTLPDSYCNTCRTDLEHACEFRDRVWKAQEYFRSIEFKEKYNLNIEVIELSPTLNPFESQVFEHTLKDDLFIEEQSGQAISNFNNETEVLLEEKCNSSSNSSEFSSQVFTEQVHVDKTDGLDEECSENETKHTQNAQNTTPKQKNKLFLKKLKRNKKPKSKHGTKRTMKLRDSKNTKKLQVDKESDLDEESNENEEKQTDSFQKSKAKQKEQDTIKFVCEQCGNYFTSRHIFETHLRRHAGDKQFQCEICADKFFTNADLGRHMRLHTGERPYSCRYCERNFIDCSKRSRHERTHTNERPFSCNHCGKTFTSSYVLKNHMLTHTGERSFRCNLCNRDFRRQTHLTTHYRSTTHQQNEIKEKLEISKLP